MNEELANALKTALEFEEKGYKIYEQASKKTNNPIVAKTFAYLAEQELNHISEIEGFLDNNEIDLKGDKPEETKKFFMMTTDEFKEKTELSDDDIQAHETAMELEKIAYEFYKKELETVEDYDLKLFFTFLMEQENAHFMLVQKALDFIKDPIDFFAQEEEWMFEG